MHASRRCFSSVIRMTIAILALASLAATEGQRPSLPSTPSAKFSADNAKAMDRMMAAMTVRSSGNVDRDFVSTMVPHHRGAIEMALAELRFGTDETLRRMAQEIIVEQQQEIAAMQLVAEKLPGALPVGPDPSDICTSSSAL